MKYVFGSKAVFFNKFKQFFIFILIAGFSVPAGAAVATATVSVDITSTIIVTTVNGLVFGDISSSAQAGTLALSPAGVRTATGGVTVNTAIAGSSAAFNIQGDPNASYSVSFPGSLVMTNGSPNSMVVDNFTYSPNTTSVIGPGGQTTLYVGATLNVNSNQAFGAYTGLLNVTIDYN